MSEPTKAGQEPQGADAAQEKPKTSRLRKWTRRAFIGAGAVAGGGLLVGVGGIVFAPNRLKYLPPGATPGDGQLGTWIKISPDNLVTVLIPHCEMGQGALTGLGMLLAEELDADWDLVEIRQAPAEDVYANGYIINAFLGEVGFTPPGWLQRPLDFTAFKMADIFGIMTTGGSTSTRGTGAFGMRLAGASARANAACSRASNGLSGRCRSAPATGPSSRHRWQATVPPSGVASPTGSSTEHRSIACGHRGWNRQPTGGASGLGGSPASTARRDFAPGTGTGTAASSARVYG